MEIQTTIKNGLPCIARVTDYHPPFNGRVGHWDDWLPDEPEDFGFELCTVNGKPSQWLASIASPADFDRINEELSKAIEEAQNDY